MWQAFVDLIASGLVFFNDTLVSFGVPYSFGFAIILFTVVIKLLTFPLNQIQMKSARAQQELQPKLKVLQKKYANDKEKLAQAQMALYKEAGVNPLGGCLPMLVQMPVWIALYQALYNLSSQNVALKEGFFWIPSLAGPVANQAAGISWLWPLPPAVGWADAIAYLVLPVLLVVSQLYMQRMMTPQTDDPQMKSMNQAMMFMPFMFGYFALVVPSGLSLYWFVNNILSMAQQYYTNRMKINVPDEKTIQAELDKLTVEPLSSASKLAVKKEDSPLKNGNGQKAQSAVMEVPDDEVFIPPSDSFAPFTIVVEGSGGDGIDQQVDLDGNTNANSNESNPTRTKSKRKPKK